MSRQTALSTVLDPDNAPGGPLPRRKTRQEQMKSIIACHSFHLRAPPEACLERGCPLLADFLSPEVEAERERYLQTPDPVMQQPPRFEQIQLSCLLPHREAGSGKPINIIRPDPPRMARQRRAITCAIETSSSRGLMILPIGHDPPGPRNCSHDARAAACCCSSRPHSAHICSFSIRHWDRGTSSALRCRAALVTPYTSKESSRMRS